MSLRSQFTDAEWSTLEKTPVWAFLLTAAADGNVDKKEVEAFAKELAETMLYKDELAREVFMSTATRLDSILPSTTAAPAAVIAGLKSAGEIVDAKCPANAEAFKGSVLNICRNVAEASGGGLFGGKKVSDLEKTALVVVATSLGVKLS
jgi:hypothetical protein